MPATPTDSRERALAKLLPRNGLLAALPQEAQARLLPHLGLVDLRPGQTVLEQGGAPVRAFFPLAGLVSLTQESADGSNALVALVGCEGLLGLSLLARGRVMHTRAVVQCPGFGLALGRERLMEEWHRGGSFMRVLLRYARTLKAQGSMLAKCRRDHTIEQQLCRLLLMSMERLPGQEVGFTLDAVARLLGAGPQSVAQAVRQLHEAGVIVVHRHDDVGVADAAGLQARACGCNRRLRDQHRRLLSAPLEPDAPDDYHHPGAQPAPWAAGPRAFTAAPLDGPGPW